MNKFFEWLDEKFKRTDGKQDYCSCSPDVIAGVDISYCCRIHDKQYEEKVFSRKLSDKMFRYNIQYYFKDAGKPIRGFFMS